MPLPNFDMELCEDQHDEIAYASKLCPLCYMREELLHKQSVLEAKVEELEAERANLVHE